MKKLIMFVMVFAIATPAMAVIEDGSPPDWGGTTPSGHVVYQIDTDYGVPTCYSYDPGIGVPEFVFFNDDGTWDSIDGTLTLPAVANTSFHVPAPVGAGANLTVRVQLAQDTEPGEEIGIEAWGPLPHEDTQSYLAEMFPPVTETPPGSGVWVSEGTFEDTAAVYIGIFTWGAEETNIISGLIIDILRHDGAKPTSGPGRTMCVSSEPPSPIVIDPNVMLVYETDETEGDFDILLRNEPPAGATITITVDPNAGGPSEDITLIGGSGVLGSITFDVNDSNWDEPYTICFKAIDDKIPEPPNIEETLRMFVSSSWPAHPTDANFVGTKGVKVTVVDNDQPNILFTYTLPEKNPVYADVTGPVQLWEELRVRYGTPYIRWRKIGVTLQVPPEKTEDGSPTEVKLQVELQSEDFDWNLPIMDPPLTVTSEPNSLTFTAANYATRQVIKIWGNDDDVLQAEGAEQEGDQNYQAQVVFTVIDGGGDERYQWTIIEEPEDPCDPVVETLVGLERTVDIDIEDNECGAFGTRSLDVGNPNAFTDPNFLDEEGNPLPDCIVDINDAIWLAIEWLDCSNISDPSCESYL